MAQAVYHYIENYSNVGKIGIAYTAIIDMLKESIKDIKHMSLAKGSITCEVGKDKIFYVIVHVNIDYGHNANKIGEAIQERVESALLNMCEIKNVNINVKLEGINIK